MDCQTVLTYVYSSECVQYLEKLFEVLKSTFSVKASLSEAFYYGVFCNTETYANFKHYSQCKCDVPDILLNNFGASYGRVDYVDGFINKIILGEIQKPEWMLYVEENETFNQFEDAPSTFLRLIPKDEKYRKLGEALLNFLYSPNLIMTLKH